MYKLIALDMDGTLLTTEKKISEKTKVAIKAAEAKGVKIVLASGRPLLGINRSLEELELLKGDDYASPVSFWMPFNGGIGIHDANWRYEFGRNIYMTNGSHGCVNMPPEMAGKLFELISAGTPVVVHN